MKNLTKKTYSQVERDHPCCVKKNTDNSKCKEGDLVWSYQYGIGEVLHKNTATMILYPLNKTSHLFSYIECLFILRKPYKQANRECAAYWEIELLPEAFQQVETEEDYSILVMLYPDMSEDLKRDLIKYVIKTSSKEKMQKIFKKMLTLKSVLLRCITSRDSK